MSEVLQRYRTVAHGFTTRVAGVEPDGWSRATPCSDWTVADLVAHVIATHHRVLATLEGTDAVDVDPEKDLVRQWRPATETISEALGDEERASKIMSGMFGEQTFASLVGRLLCSDTLLHTWDLARATGQDESLDTEAVTKALEALTPLDEGLRRPGGFAPRIASAPEADIQTELLNFCGRSCTPL